MSGTAQSRPRLLRVKEAAQILNISAWKLRRLIQQGEIRYVKYEASGPWWIDVHDIDKFIEKHKQ